MPTTLLHIDSKTITSKHNTNDILADIMHIAFDRGHHHNAGDFGIPGFFFFNERAQIGHGFFHDAGTFNDLRQEHFSGTE